MLKSHKEARLKVFKSSKDAEHFSHHGFEENLSISGSATQLANMADKSPFRGPKSQDLVSFRKAIEQGKYNNVRDIIWKNPRYLVGSGDTPTILKVNIVLFRFCISAQCCLI